MWLKYCCYRLKPQHKQTNMLDPYRKIAWTSWYKVIWHILGWKKLSLKNDVAVRDLIPFEIWFMEATLASYDRHVNWAVLIGDLVDIATLLLKLNKKNQGLLRMWHLLEGVFSRITMLWNTLIQILSYHELAFLLIVLKCAAKSLKIGLQIKI